MESKNTPNQSLHELVEFHNKLFGKNNFDDDLVAAFGDEEKAKEEVYSEIKDDIKNADMTVQRLYCNVLFFYGNFFYPKNAKDSSKRNRCRIPEEISDDKEADLDTISDTIPSTNTNAITDTIPADEYLVEYDNVDSAMEQL